MRILKRIVYAIIAILLFFILSAFFFTKETQPLQKADIIIVLGSPSIANGGISPTQKSRTDKGIELYQQGLAGKLLFTGGAAWNKIVESETMKAYAIQRGIPNNDILTEGNSSNTDENAEEAYKLLKAHDFDRIIVVSSKYHTRRASFLFNHYPLEVQVCGVDYDQRFWWQRNFFPILNEYFGFARHFLYALIK